MITVVSGLPRSGTSLVMQMLAAGGHPILSDGRRAADEDNPKGYLEFEQVKSLERDQSWMKDADGKAVKIVEVEDPNFGRLAKTRGNPNPKKNQRSKDSKHFFQVKWPFLRNDFLDHQMKREAFFSRTGS
jgi:hypothetical protein